MVGLPLQHRIYQGATYEWYFRKDTLINTSEDTLKNATRTINVKEDYYEYYFKACANVNGCITCSHYVNVNLICVFPPPTPISVSIRPLLDQPSILQADPSTNSVSGYKWYKNGEQIQGATTSILTSSGPGKYDVCVTTSSSSTYCTQNHDGKSYIITDIAQDIATSMTIAPNPVRQQCTIKRNGYTGMVGIRLTNSLGQTVYTNNARYTSDGISVNTIGMSAGVYSLTVQTDSGKAVKRLVIR